MIRLLPSLALLAASSACQDLLWSVEGVGGLLSRGIDLHRLGDWNGDGYEDLLEKGAYAQSPNPSFGGWIAMRIVSGYDGSILSAHHLPFPWTIANSAPLGDVDLDGVPDYGAHYYNAQSPSQTQSLAVFSGATQQILWTAQIPNAWGTYYAHTLCGDLDTDGDGRRDVVTCAPKLSGGGTILVYDHAGIERYRIIDPIPGAQMGWDVASVGGDLDGDGCADFVVSGSEPLARGILVAFSGRTGAVIRSCYGEQPFDQLVRVAACGDLDGDGVPDLCGAGGYSAAVITAFSGASGQIIHSWRDAGVCCMGENVAGGQDLDQDGTPDLIGSSRRAATNVLSGRDGSFMFRLPMVAGTPTCDFTNHAMLAPPPGEQYPLFVIAESCGSLPNNPCGPNNMCPGIVRCYRGCPPGVRRYGQPDATANQPFASQGMRSISPSGAPRVRFSLSEAPAGAGAILLLGASNVSLHGYSLPWMLDPFGLPGITVWQSAEVCLLTIAGGSGPAAGYAQFECPLPTGTTFGYTGPQLFAQWIWFDPTDFHTHGSTAGQRFRLQ